MFILIFQYFADYWVKNPSRKTIGPVFTWVHVGAICTQIIKSFATNAFKSSFYDLVKGDTDESKMRYQTKAAEHIG